MKKVLVIAGPTASGKTGSYEFGGYHKIDLETPVILQKGQHYSIVLTPKKRFYPRNNVFFPETQGEEIVDMFGENLPMEPVKLDLLDHIVRILRI